MAKEKDEATVTHVFIKGGVRYNLWSLNDEWEEDRNYRCINGDLEDVMHVLKRWVEQQVEESKRIGKGNADMFPLGTLTLEAFHVA